MRIAFDQQIFSFQEYGGVSRYFCNLARNLSEISGVEARIFAPFHVNAYLSGLSSGIRTGIKVKALPRATRIRKHTSRLLAMPLMRVFRPDIVHETYYSANAYAPKGVGRVVTAYDMTHRRFPGMFGDNDSTICLENKTFARADHIICISENTRRDLLEWFDVPSEKVSVVYLGVAPLNPHVERNGPPCTGPYILYVGQRGGYKNFGNFIRAYASSKWLRSNFRILCFGGGAFTSTEASLMAEHGVNESHARQIGGGDSLLAECYRHAAALVYPSLYEGFGIPLLEAMSVGCPVICSNASSIPEVVGQAGECFDPTDIDAIRSSVERVLQSLDLRTGLVAKGLERCKLFTWKKCAMETLAIYRTL